MANDHGEQNERLRIHEEVLAAARATRERYDAADGFRCVTHDAMCDDDHPCQGCAIEQTPETTADLQAIQEQVRPGWRP